VKAHLAPFLPGHLDTPGSHVGAVSGAPLGNASVLPISYVYIALMGAAGLTRATAVAILAANYMARRLEPHFPILYTAANATVAHECIVDLRPLKAVGVSVVDIAKRLIDYGFHAPTVSFPVAGTMMIEPTESESQVEIDRFCDAMIAIRREIQSIEEGTFDSKDNPLVNAPHTAESIAADEWPHPYSRRAAVYPEGRGDRPKYWPPVGRIDELAGDRNLVCACPPTTEYA